MGVLEGGSNYCCAGLVVVDRCFVPLLSATGAHASCRSQLPIDAGVTRTPTEKVLCGQFDTPGAASAQIGWRR